jgi:hypothetical protein
MNNYLKVNVLIAIIALLSGCSSAKMTGEEKSAKEAALRDAINKREYAVDVNHMIPMKGSSKHLSSPYSVTVKGDELVSYLPYFGEAYNIPYGGGKGLNFKAKINSYNFIYDNKGKAVIELETKNEEGQYKYHIEIFPNGSASVNVTSYNRQPISFLGTAKELEKSETE